MSLCFYYNQNEITFLRETDRERERQTEKKRKGEREREDWIGNNLTGNY